MRTTASSKRAAKTGQLELPVSPWRGTHFESPFESGCVAIIPSTDAASAATREPFAETSAVVSEPDSAPPLPLDAGHTLPIDPADVQRWWRAAWRASGRLGVPDLSIASAWGAVAMLRHSRFPHEQDVRRGIEIYLGRWEAAVVASGGELRGEPDVEVFVTCYAPLLRALAGGQDPASIIVRAHSVATAGCPSKSPSAQPHESRPLSTVEAPCPNRSTPAIRMRAAAPPEHARSDRTGLLALARRKRSAGRTWSGSGSASSHSSVGR